ncbi:hypothetical protein VUR80DRAFT_2650 [Thermomyces stellatus]
MVLVEVEPILAVDKGRSSERASRGRHDNGHGRLVVFICLRFTHSQPSTRSRCRGRIHRKAVIYSTSGRCQRQGPRLKRPVPITGSSRLTLGPGMIHSRAVSTNTLTSGLGGQGRARKIATRPGSPARVALRRHRLYISTLYQNATLSSSQIYIQTVYVTCSRTDGCSPPQRQG